MNEAPPGTVQVGRVAMRQEGKFVNVYYAQNHTMDGAILLISTPRAVAHLPGVRDKLLDIGRHVMREIAVELHGKDLTQWNDPVTAPEHERAGNA